LEDEISARNALQDSQFTIHALEEEKNGLLKAWQAEVREVWAHIRILK
jgi:hypothetical protein